MKLPLEKEIDNQALSQVFEFISGVLQLQGANRFRVRAYDTAAATLQDLNQPWHQYLEEKQDLTQIPGIGNTIAEKLEELHQTGTIAAFQEYVAAIPEGVWAINQVHGLGVKRAHLLATTFDLDDASTALDILLQKADAGLVADLPGFGEKSQEKLITQIKSHKIQTERMPYPIAQAKAEEVIAALKTCDAVTKIEVLGSLRRKATTVGDVDLGVTTNNVEQLQSCVEQLDLVDAVIAAGEGLIRIRTIHGDQVDIKISTDAEWGAFIQHFTGSKQHNIKLREYALSQGKSLSEHGIKDLETQEIHPVSNEESFYAELGLNWIPPQERQGGDEIEQAKRQ